MMHEGPTQKAVTLFVAALVFFSLAAARHAGCSTVVETADTPQIEVEDFRGKKLIFSKPVCRVVCLLESALTGLYMLGAEDRVVGVSANAYNGVSAPYYAAMDPRIKGQGLPVVSSSTTSSLERIIALKPDLVVLWSLNKETISTLEERGIPVFGVYIDGVEDIYREVLALGEMTGTGRRAREIVDFTRSEVGLVLKMISSVPREQWPKVYFMWAKGELDSAGRDSIVQELLDAAGAVNICAHITQEHVVLSMEHLLVSNPDIIVMWYNALLDPIDIAHKPAWKSLAAARNSRIHEMPDLFACDLCTLNFQYSLKLLARWCHPELFTGQELEREPDRTFSMLFGARLPKELIAARLGLPRTPP